MFTHIARTMQTYVFYIRRLQQVRHLLGCSVATKLVSAFATLWLDHGIHASKSIITPLQCVLNVATRLVLGLQP